MRILVVVDAEGLQGVVNQRQIHRSGDEYSKLVGTLKEDILAVVEGLNEDDTSEIYVVDSHDDSTNIDWDFLPEGVNLITGSPKPLGMVEGVQRCQKAVFLGFHPMAGSYGVLSETYSPAVHRVWVNDDPIGEIGICAAVCGFHDVPVILFCGDDLAVKEAKGVLSECEFLATKTPLSFNAAETRSTAAVVSELRSLSRKSLSSHAKPFKIPGEIILKVEFESPLMADNCVILPGVKRVDPYTVSIKAENILSAYGYFRALVMIGQAGSKF